MTGNLAVSRHIFSKSTVLVNVGQHLLDFLQSAWWQLVLVLRLVMMMKIITIVTIITIITNITIGLLTAALVLLLYEIQQMLTELQTALSQVLNELQRFLKKENSPKFNGQDDGHFILGPALKV